MDLLVVMQLITIPGSRYGDVKRSSSRCSNRNVHRAVAVEDQRGICAESLDEGFLHLLLFMYVPRSPSLSRKDSE